MSDGRLRKAWSVWVKGLDGFDTFYAPTAGKARAAAWRSIGDVRDVRVVDITVRRAWGFDKILPLRDPMADLLTADETHCLLHAYGADQGDPTKAGYRSYFYTRRDDLPLVGLVARGLMSAHEDATSSDGMATFLLTSIGKRVALSLVPEYPAWMTSTTSASRTERNKG